MGGHRNPFSKVPPLLLDHPLHQLIHPSTHPTRIDTGKYPHAGPELCLLPCDEDDDDYNSLFWRARLLPAPPYFPLCAHHAHPQMRIFKPFCPFHTFYGQHCSTSHFLPQSSHRRPLCVYWDKVMRLFSILLYHTLRPLKPSFSSGAHLSRYDDDNENTHPTPIV